MTWLIVCSPSRLEMTPGMLFQPPSLWPWRSVPSMWKPPEPNTAKLSAAITAIETAIASSRSRRRRRRGRGPSAAIANGSISPPVSLTPAATTPSTPPSRSRPQTIAYSAPVTASSISRSLWPPPTP